jgi:tetratricopeptide (TPR) repeat protein
LCGGGCHRSGGGLYDAPMRTGNTLFSPTAHVVLCQSCGAPIEAAIVGGVLACRYCNAQNRIAGRSETAVSATRGPQLPEHERLARLRAQDGRPLLPPQSLVSLMPDGDIPVWKMQEALAVWQSTRRELATSNSYEAAERLLFLTMALANCYSEQNDLVRQRAMFESALDAFTLPRHRQTMRCYLARAAAKQGDLQGAEAWLAPCDAFSDDLGSDSEHRFSRALIDTFNGNFQRVLEVLGSAPEAVPIQDAMDDVCAVFRANALERMGYLQPAVEQLKQRMSKGPRERTVIAKVIEVYRPWGVCAQSFSHADNAHAAVAAIQAEQLGGGMLASVFIPLGGLFVLIAAGCFIGMIVAVVAGEWEWLIGPGICLITMGPMGAGFLFSGLKSREAAKRAGHLRMHGLRARGRVQSATPTGMSVNEVPEVQMQIVVELPGRAPFTASTKMMASNPQVLVPGAVIGVRVDPNDPTNVLVESD